MSKSAKSSNVELPKTEYSEIMEGLKHTYRKKIAPVESAYNFDAFHSPLLTDGDIDAKPMILLLGQYSTGKTSFIQYLMGQEYAGSHIGPEPTTDRFVAVVGGKENRAIPGNAATLSPDLPFTGLTKFGSSFLAKFQVSETNCPFLDSVTLIDTPGVLSGEKQRIGRSYEFVEVVEWYAQRADMILLLFDAHKLDVSDEFRDVIMCLRGQDDKIKIVLNKADMVSTQQLMRIYGALMWSLGKIFKTPEVVRVYIGSFWNEQIKTGCELKALLETEMKDLMKDIKELPKNSAVRKLNEIAKRARLAKIHAHIIGQLKEEMPTFFGKQTKQQKLLDNLPKTFAKVQSMNRFPIGDFPDTERFKQNLQNWNIAQFPKWSEKMIRNLDEALSQDLPSLMHRLPTTQKGTQIDAVNPFVDDIQANDAYFNSINDVSSPRYWVYNEINKTKYMERFNLCTLHDGKVTGVQAKPVLEESGLQKDILAKIWRLADWTKDGKLDLAEFVAAMHMINWVQAGGELPDTLPLTMLPSTNQ